MQRKKIYGFAKHLIPYITEDDLLHPYDFPKLEKNPYFRYEVRCFGRSLDSSDGLSCKNARNRLFFKLKQRLMSPLKGALL